MKKEDMNTENCVPDHRSLSVTATILSGAGDKTTDLQLTDGDYVLASLEVFGTGLAAGDVLKLQVLDTDHSTVIGTYVTQRYIAPLTNVKEPVVFEVPIKISQNQYVRVVYTVGVAVLLTVRVNLHLYRML